MNDWELFKRTIIERLDQLENLIINEGQGIEMGKSPDWIKEQFKLTKNCLFGNDELENNKFPLNKLKKGWD